MSFVNSQVDLNKIGLPGINLVCKGQLLSHNTYFVSTKDKNNNNNKTKGKQNKKHQGKERVFCPCVRLKSKAKWIHNKYQSNCPASVLRMRIAKLPMH